MGGYIQDCLLKMSSSVLYCLAPTCEREREVLRWRHSFFALKYSGPSGLPLGSTHFWTRWALGSIKAINSGICGCSLHVWKRNGHGRATIETTIETVAAAAAAHLPRRLFIQGQKRKDLGSLEKCPNLIIPTNLRPPSRKWEGFYLFITTIGHVDAWMYL